MHNRGLCTSGVRHFRVLCRNVCRYGYNYYGMGIGNRTQALKWHHFQWPWVILTQILKSHLLERPTATGIDGLPVRFLRLSAPWIASPISHIFNMSYSSSVVPVQWKLSCITPVPKTNQPVDCVDFRPISVTPVLSRVLERLIVRRDLYPVLVNPDVSHLFHDQFAFRPTGSTTAALICLFHHLTHSLKKSQFCPSYSFRLL